MLTSVDFRTDGIPVVRAHIFIPPGHGPDSRLLAVMHGKLRNAAEYIEPWREWAASTNHVVVAPQFDRSSWPGSRGYNLGNVFSGDNGSGRLLAPREWSFSVVEAICAQLTHRLGLRDRSLSIWGHSAGAQFVHRFLLFKPRVRVRAAIAAGAGWFTLADPSSSFPYGLSHPRLAFSETELRAYLRSPLTIMRGELDTDADEDLRQTSEARAQGGDRFERAGHAFECARDQGGDWTLVDVPGVGHDWAAMALAAQKHWDHADARPEAVLHG